MVEEKQIEEARQILLEKLNNPLPMDYDSPVEYTSKKINWCDELECWDQCKAKNLEINAKNNDVGAQRMIFLAHSRDTISGKPQLIHQTIQKIPVLKKVEKYIKSKNPDNDKFLTFFKHLDDPFDKRYDGNIVDTLAFDFWVYRLIDSGKD
jgi:hypothetical protein